MGTAHVGDRKRIVRRVVDEVIVGGRMELVDELFTEPMARRARRWFEPFRASFPDVRMEVVLMVAEGDTVVGRFRCSATHLGSWQGEPPTGRRFERVDEVYFFRFVGDRISDMWGLEDVASRRRQLGIDRPSG
jgi:predicted ester cyclase